MACGDVIIYTISMFIALRRHVVGIKKALPLREIFVVPGLFFGVLSAAGDRHDRTLELFITFTLRNLYLQHGRSDIEHRPRYYLAITSLSPYLGQ